jgi:hypothetical protein
MTSKRRSTPSEISNVADEQTDELDSSSWMILFGFGLVWTLACTCFGTLITLASTGVIGVDNGDQKPLNLGVLGVALAMYSLGPALMSFGWSERASTARAKALRDQFPGKPWKWDPRSSSGFIPANAASEAFWAWYGATALALFLVPFVVQLTLVSFDWRVLILVPFLFIDALIFRFAWRRTSSARRYGKMGLQLSQLPLVPGTSFEATLKVPESLEGSAKARLSCDKTIVRRNNRKRETHTETVFETTKDVTIAVSGATSLIKVAFDLPASPSGPAFTWRLELNATGLSEQFDLPVFANVTEVERFASQS